jgi:hypothetical protein
MQTEENDLNTRKAWVQPEIRELDVQETYALPRRGADIGGNPAVDCQFS